MPFRGILRKFTTKILTKLLTEVVLSLTGAPVRLLSGSAKTCELKVLYRGQCYV